MKETRRDEAPEPCLADAMLTYENAANQIVDAVTRFANADDRSGRKQLGGFLLRLGNSLTHTWRQDGESFGSILRQNLTESEFAAELAAALVRTGLLRTRSRRSELGGCLYAARLALCDPAVPDELWERGLDRTNLEPSERFRWIAARSPNFMEFIESDAGDPVDDEA